MKRYGVPYKGSKNKIARQIIDILPAGEVFVDLFAGGCAITHAAMESGKWAKFIVNDIDPMPVQLFQRAVRGDYANEKRWISREDFNRLKDKDPYVRFCWSFGNNGGSYLYAKEVEPWKKALHYARMFGDASLFVNFGIKSDGSSKDIREHKEKYKQKYIRWYLENVICSDADIPSLMQKLNENIEKNKGELRKYLLDALQCSGLTQAEVQRRLGTQMAGHYFGRSQWEFPTREMYNRMSEFMPLPKTYDKIYGLQELLESLQRLQSLQSLQSLQRLQSLQSLESLQRLQSLQSLQRLQSLQSLQRLQSFSLDYRSLNIPPGATVYADPPYAGTEGYGFLFDHVDFWEWVRTRPFPVYISEYNAPDDFVSIVQIEKRVTLCSGGGKKAIEKLFVHRRFFEQNYMFADLPLFARVTA